MHPRAINISTQLCVAKQTLHFVTITLSVTLCILAVVKTYFNFHLWQCMSIYKINYIVLHSVVNFIDHDLYVILS